MIFLTQPKRPITNLSNDLFCTATLKAEMWQDQPYFLFIHLQKSGRTSAHMQIMQAVYNKRPFIPKNSVVWDTKLVLDFMSKWHPAKNLSLKQLSIKTVLLCLLVSGLRGQTIWLMNFKNMQFLKDRVMCAKGDPLKTTNAKSPK